MRKGGVRNSWCPSGARRSFLLFASGLLVSFPYYAAVVVFAQSPCGDSNVNHNIACTICGVILECIHAAPLVGISILAAWYTIIAIQWKPLHWFFRRATHFAAGFYQGLELNRLLSSKEDDGKEEYPAEGLSLTERYICCAFALSVWHALLVVSLCAEKIEQEAGQRKIKRQPRPSWTVVFARGLNDDDETEEADELDELETAYSPMPAALVDGQRRCRNE
jgi:hypothetical protein